MALVSFLIIADKQLSDIVETTSKESKIKKVVSTKTTVEFGCVCGGEAVVMECVERMTEWGMLDSAVKGNGR